MNLNIFKNINISSIANTTSKALNIIKKTIPIYKEIKPFISKEKQIIPQTKKESMEEPSKYNDSLTFFQ